MAHLDYILAQDQFRPESGDVWKGPQKRTPAKRYPTYDRRR